jgi:hypothetical protein
MPVEPLKLLVRTLSLLMCVFLILGDLDSCLSSQSLLM